MSYYKPPNLDTAVMDASKPGHIVRSKDSSWMPPMEYLCLNRMPISTQALAMDWSFRKKENWLELLESMNGRESFPYSGAISLEGED
eukprot:scaffold10313_cov138-Cylindrotheca_fusiformis.AAC.1